MGRGRLKRVIQKAVQDPLAELILSGKVKDGETVDGLGRAGQAEPRLQRRGGGERGGVRPRNPRRVLPVRHAFTGQ